MKTQEDFKKLLATPRHPSQSQNAPSLGSSKHSGSSRSFHYSNTSIVPRNVKPSSKHPQKSTPVIPFKPSNKEREIDTRKQNLQSFSDAQKLMESLMKKDGDQSREKEEDVKSDDSYEEEFADKTAPVKRDIPRGSAQNNDVPIKVTQNGSDDDDIFGDVGTEYEVTMKSKPEQKATGSYFTKPLENEEAPAPSKTEFLKQVIKDLPNSEHSKPKDSTAKSNILTKLEAKDVADSNYFDEGDLRQGRNVSMYVDDGDEFLSEEDEEFLATLKKSRDDFETEDEWRIYKETQLIRWQAGSTDINMNNYKLFEERDSSKSEAKKFGRDMDAIDTIMKRKYGETIRAPTKKPKK